jgi:hypothetical protein
MAALTVEMRLMDSPEVRAVVEDTRRVVAASKVMAAALAKIAAGSDDLHHTIDAQNALEKADRLIRGLDPLPSSQG